MHDKHVVLIEFIKYLSLLKEYGMKKMLLIAAMVMAVVTGCHTIHGVGQDVKAGGQHLSNAANR